MVRALPVGAMGLDGGVGAGPSVWIVLVLRVLHGYCIIQNLRSVKSRCSSDKLALILSNGSGYRGRSVPDIRPSAPRSVGAQYL
jgi:hypothetical protein